MSSGDSSSDSESSSRKRKREKKELKKQKKKQRKDDTKKKSKKQRKEESDDDESGDDGAPSALPSVALPAGVAAISLEDYFGRMEEFRVWLKESRDEYFEDLETKDARRRFAKFAAQWNAGRLDRMFYTGIPTNVRDRCRRTRHAWAFKLSESEKWDLASTKDSIDVAARKGEAEVARAKAAKTAKASSGGAARGGDRQSGQQRRQDELSQRAHAARTAEQDRNAAFARALLEQTGGKRLVIPARKPGA